MYHGIHTENELFYPEAQKVLYTCQLSSITMHIHFPSQSMVTHVVTATSSQRVCNEASNLGAVPYVDLNA
jgi:hypothetical protein